MKRFIILILFLFTTIFSSTYCEFYRANLIEFEANENLILGKTSRLNFNMTISIDKKMSSYEDFCCFFYNTNNDFMKLVDLKFENSRYRNTNGKIYFEEKNGSCPEVIYVNFSGVAIFDWSKIKLHKNIDNFSTDIKIGYINDEKNPIVLNLCIESFNPVRDIKISVKEDMDLGVVFSGETFNTKNYSSGAKPAIISIETSVDSKLKISIPSFTKISNNNDDNLDVKLYFRENNSNVIIKNVDSTNGSIYRIDNVIIDGQCKTTTDSRGKYEGSFVVRVEYLNE